ncbi:MAG TPA: hypothetical protein V6D17_05440 [Candidatus Obscuribacterales bacterium]
MNESKKSDSANCTLMRRLIGIACGSGLAFLIFVLPLAGLRRSWTLAAYAPDELALLLSALVAGGLSGALRARRTADKAAPDSGKPTTLAQTAGKWLDRQAFTIIALFFVAFYTACSALCLRLRLFLITGNPLLDWLLSLSGLFAFFSGSIIIVRALANDRDRPRAFECFGATIAHPIFFAWLLILSGIPLVVGTWLPLIGLPGVFIAMKWQIHPDQQDFEDPLPELTDDGKKGWHLIPYVY